MGELGNRLRQQREARGLSLADAEAVTRIKSCYLEALEMEDWAALPGEVQARGFLRNYARYLGLDPVEVLALYDGGPSPIAPAPSTIASNGGARAAPAPPTGKAPEDQAIFRPQGMGLEPSPSLPWGLLLILLVLALGGVFGLRLWRSSSGGGGPVPEATAPSAPLAGAAVATETAPTALPTAPALTPTPTFAVRTDLVEMALTAREHVWVQVFTDGRLAFEGILAPGTPQQWSGRQQVAVHTGNGAGVEATVNGQPQGPLGGRGEVVLRAWSPAGPATPLPTTTPTPLPTPSP